MSLRDLLTSAAPSQETVLTLGFFDGVHLGHCHLLRHLVQRSTPSLLSTVLTFSNHPNTVLRPGTHLGYLTIPEDKIRLLKEQGVEAIVSLEFTHELSQVTAHDFVSILFDTLGMRGLVVGPDTALGRNREGNISFLRQRGEELGFWVEVVEPFTLDGDPVKSRMIRKDIAAGDVAAGARMLGRNFYLTGSVVVGDRRGRELGFPTANVDIEGQLILPKDGIYSSWAVIDGHRYPSATSIGTRPTFNLTQRLVEVHLIDFNADIYGKRVGVEFVSRLRDQEKFSDVDQLIQQIDRDVADSRIALARDRGTHVA
jgi:riboflavin kinase/FMN adenylyltransferase